jgi:hypothetical protein
MRQLHISGTYISCNVLMIAETFQRGSRMVQSDIPIGTEFEVIEVLAVPEEDRVRARIKNPEGWISLCRPSDGFCWAVLKEQEEVSVGSARTRDVLEEAKGSETAVTDEDVHEAAPHTPGTYITCNVLMIAETFQRDSRVVHTDISIGTEVEVIEVLAMPEEDRVRAKIRNPEGWISLCRPSDGFCWAVLKAGTGCKESEVGETDVCEDAKRSLSFAFAADTAQIQENPVEHQGIDCDDVIDEGRLARDGLEESEQKSGFAAKERECDGDQCIEKDDSADEEDHEEPEEVSVGSARTRDSTEEAKSSERAVLDNDMQEAVPVLCTTRRPEAGDVVKRVPSATQRVVLESVRGKRRAWILEPGASATVVAVDGDENFQLRNPSGVVSKFLLREKWMYDHCQAAGDDNARCKMGHPLSYCVPGRDTSNICDGCGREEIRAPEPVFRCERCDYDLCQWCYKRGARDQDEESQYSGEVGSFAISSCDSGSFNN